MTVSVIATMATQTPFHLQMIAASADRSFANLLKPQWLRSSGSMLFHLVWVYKRVDVGVVVVVVAVELPPELFEF